MFSAEQYRAKAAEFKALLMNILRSSNKTSELRSLEQTYTPLAENEEWMAINKTIQRRKNREKCSGSRRPGRMRAGMTRIADVGKKRCDDTAPAYPAGPRNSS
jgi:hypothetical protein